jgi:hypothetical protein
MTTDNTSPIGAPQGHPWGVRSEEREHLLGAREPMTTEHSNTPAPLAWDPWGPQSGRDAFLDQFTGEPEPSADEPGSYWAGHVVAAIPAASPQAEALRQLLPADGTCFRLSPSEEGGCLVRAFELAPGVLIGELEPGGDLEVVVTSPPALPTFPPSHRF